MSWAGSEGAGSWRDGACLGRAVRYNDEPTFRGVIGKDKWTKVNERNRAYHFANGVSTSIDHIEWVWVSSTGTHYLKTNSHIHIVKKDWVRITITE